MKQSTVISGGFYAAVFTASLLFVTQVNLQAQTASTRHIHQVVRSGDAKFYGALPASQKLRLHVVLPLRDSAGLDQFLADVYDPASPNYRNFLTPAEFTDRFGPAQQDYDALTSYVRSNGFRIVGGSRDGMDLQIEGSVRTIEKAFHVVMNVYKHPAEDRTFYSADREPTLGLPFPIWHISGLDNYSIPQPRLVKRDDSPRAKKPDPDAPAHATTGSGPSASFLGSDMRAAYYGGTLTGAGQTLGLWEYQGTDLADVNNYYAGAHQTNNVPITLRSVDGTSTSCVYSVDRCDDTEPTLDITQALGMAPGLSGVTVYIGSYDTTIASAMTTSNPLPGTIGCSWGWSPADPTTLYPYFKKMGAQGQNFFAASGDYSTWTARGNSAAWPADDAYVVSVGGTDLQTSGAGGPWLSETAWVDSGGGISPDGIAIPSWQAGAINSNNRGSTTMRNGPDVAANADFTFYVCANQTTCSANLYGGTSFAAPMWAGYVALANQQAAANGKGLVGFINPIIYGSGNAPYFHDINSGASGSYSAVAGYDLVTGWGSPNGAALINALAPVSSPNFGISASPSSITVAQGAAGSSTITTTAVGGFNAAISLNATGQPSGVTVTFNPPSVPAPGSGASTMNITVGSTVPAGAYTITVTGIGGGQTNTTLVSLTVLAPSFTISASPTSISLKNGRRGATTITTTATGGFNSSISLSASGLPTGVTASFNPTAIPAPGSGRSTLTLTAGSNPAQGNYTITVTGTGGGLTHTTTVGLTIR